MKTLFFILCLSFTHFSFSQEIDLEDERFDSFRNPTIIEGIGLSDMNELSSARINFGAEQFFTGPVRIGLGIEDVTDFINNPARVEPGSETRTSQCHRTVEGGGLNLIGASYTIHGRGDRNTRISVDGDAIDIVVDHGCTTGVYAANRSSITSSYRFEEDRITVGLRIPLYGGRIGIGQ